MEKGNFTEISRVGGIEGDADQPPIYSSLRTETSSWQILVSLVSSPRR